jgi:hypothetical protein
MTVSLYKNLKKHQKIWVWIIAVLICGVNILGAYFEFTYIRNVVEVQQLRTAGVSIQGIVRNKRVISDPEGPDTYFITYEFAASGRYFKHEQQVKGDTYRALNKKDSIEIYYLPNNPQVSRVKGEFFPDFLEKTFLLIVFVLPIHGCAIWLPFSIVKRLLLFRQEFPYEKHLEDMKQTPLRETWKLSRQNLSEQPTQVDSWDVDIGLGFVILWIFATTAGWIVGVGGGLAVGIAATEALIPESVPSGGYSGLIGVVLAFLVALPLTAIAVGVAQGLVLKRFITWSRAWTIATIPAMLVGMAIAISMGNAPLGDAALGAIIGIVQWFVLKRHLPRASWWILASLGGAVLGRVLTPGEIRFSGVVMSGITHIAIQLLIPAAIWAAITGTTLTLLFRQAAAEKTGLPDDRNTM